MRGQIMGSIDETDIARVLALLPRVSGWQNEVGDLLDNPKLQRLLGSDIGVAKFSGRHQVSGDSCSVSDDSVDSIFISLGLD